jgi:DNA sulfur modification protein DndD
MIIKSIELYNFRQYKGIQKVEFSYDKEKNVTVIIGKNTSGKTTIVQAFNWCLYEKRNFKNKDIINLEVIDSLKFFRETNAYVEIIIIHDKNEYTIRRTQKYEKNELGRVKIKRSILEVQYKDPSGAIQSIPMIEYENTINKILPVDLSDYFFFDGERIGEINNKGDVVTAVRTLMGLDVVIEARDILDPFRASSVISKFNKELDLGSNDKNMKIRNDLETERQEFSKLLKQVETCKEEIELAKIKKDGLAKKLLSNKEIKQFKMQEISLDRDIRSLEITVSSIKQSIKKTFGIESNSLGFFAYPLIQKAMKILNESKTDVEGIPDMRATAIDYLLERGHCLCGRDLNHDLKAREKVMHEKSLLPPEYIGTTIRNYKKTLKGLENNSEGFYEQINEYFKNLNNNAKLIENKKTEKLNIQNKIDKIGNIDIDLLEHDYRECGRMQKKLEEKKGSIDRKTGASESKIKTLEGQIQRLTVVNAKNQKLLHCLDYSNAIYDWFNEKYAKEEDEVKIKLLDSVNKTFQKMYHGNRAVTLSDKYHIILETKVGDTVMSTDESKGLEAVKNFSFITGLVGLARERAKEQEEKEKNIFCSEPFPLVMDAPFSNIDEIHINNIVKILPNAAEQVILILMKKDWDHAEKSISDRVASQYYIEKVNNSETFSKIHKV